MKEDKNWLLKYGGGLLLISISSIVLFIFYPSINIDFTLKYHFITFILSLILLSIVILVGGLVNKIVVGKKWFEYPLIGKIKVISQKWILLAGLGLIIICAALFAWFLSWSTGMWTEGFFVLLLGGLSVFAVDLILVGLFLRTKDRIKKAIYLFLIIFLPLWGASYIFPSHDLLLNNPLKKLAAVTKNEFVCKLLPFEYDKVYCYKDVAAVKKSLAVCDRITQEYSKRRYELNLCYIGVAKATGDESVCGKIEENRASYHNFEGDRIWATPRSICYANIAKEKKNSDLCTKIETERIRSKCYEVVGYKSDNFLIEKDDEAIKSGEALEQQKLWEGEDIVSKTSDWKVYKNEKYGFELRYPPWWVLSEEKVQDTIATIGEIQEPDSAIKEKTLNIKALKEFDECSDNTWDITLVEWPVLMHGMNFTIQSDVQTTEDKTRYLDIFSTEKDNTCLIFTFWLEVTSPSYAPTELEFFRHIFSSINFY
jgi:hypothetical protein